MVHDLFHALHLRTVGDGATLGATRRLRRTGSLFFLYGPRHKRSNLGLCSVGSVSGEVISIEN